MSKFSGRVLAILTALVCASFVARAADVPVNAGAFRDNPAWALVDGAVTSSATGMDKALASRVTTADSVTALEFKAPAGAHATLYLLGRYAVPMTGNGDWQKLTVRMRAPRYDAGFNKQQNAVAIEITTDGKSQRNVVFEEASPGARWAAEDMRGPAFFVIDEGSFAVRNSHHDPANFDQVTLPSASGGETNEKSLIDIVARGRELFTSVGCEACHRVERDSEAVSTGPNLYGLFRNEVRTREVVEGGEGHRFQVKANREYLHRSLREPAAQLAVAESGETKGAPYAALMPVFTPEIVSDEQIDAIGAYLATLNDVGQRGPVTWLGKLEPTPPYDPMADGLQWLVNDTVRMQRGPLPGTSARAIHVGFPGGVNYSFDPRLLAIVKIWQGGFLDMAGELTNRGGKGLALGYESREIGFGEREYLLAPLDAAGKTIDFTFKDAKFGDVAAIRESLYSTVDPLARIAAVDAQFLGYSRDSRDKQAAPVFRYRVAKNEIGVATTIAANGEVAVTLTGRLATPQSFALNDALLQGATPSAGKVENGRWTLPAGRLDATLRGRVALAAGAWRPAPSNYSYLRAPLVKAPATAKLPAGYTIENYYPPKDNYGRDQLFEALGLARAKDGTIVVATRTAGIWRLVDGEWRQFAEGLFDSLGVVVEDNKGLTVVAGQKAELTRIRDTNGDGIADDYRTLFDANSYHGNYHNYMHGPVRAPDGSYYLTINLVHDMTGTAYTGGGNVMGSFGGLSGWAVRVQPDGKFELFANGMRSPASLGVGPDGRVWYADNQGDFVGTSKLFVLRKDAFYGHPAGLVDLPGMTPDSPQIAWEKVAGRKERAVVMFPHNKVANSPGNPAWILGDKFGPYRGQMLIGDQTQSNLLRVVVETVDGVEQGSVMPFFEGLESGVMRPVFLPDGSLLLGQTGRGWQAKGGKIASLQHVRWDGKTVAPAIAAMSATHDGFKVTLTQPLGGGVSESLLRSALSLESWTYRDAPDYGSPELDTRNEDTTSIVVSPDRKTVLVTLATTAQPKVHPHQTARIYHLKLASRTLFDAAAPQQLDAYYTLKRFPGAK
jgi:glucose/arabinose dehydrogenase/mono/diheme cytochrome c family protein